MNLTNFLLKANKIINLVVVLAMLLALPGPALAFTWTVPEDAAPGSVVEIWGDNSDAALYNVGDLVQVYVDHDQNDWVGYCEATVNAPDGGAHLYNYWMCTVTLDPDPAVAVGSYTYATYVADVYKETGHFTDAPGTIDKVYKHWADQVDQPGGPAWQNDILSANKSDYFEGEVIPHVFVYKGSNQTPLTNGATYSINVTYNYYQNNTNAGGFAFMTTYDISRQPGPLNATNPYIPPMLDDTFSNGGGTQGVFYTVDADITDVSGVTYLGTGTKDGYVTITFTYTGVTTTNGIAEIYYGLYVAEPGMVLDQGNGTTLGAHAWTGGSLQTTVDIGGSGATSIQLSPAAILAGQISGVKFNDADGDGVKDAGETLLAGWTIQLCADSACAVILETTTTDANGAYTFSVTPDADKLDGQYDNDPYYVREVNQTGWLQTAPSGNIYGPLLITAATPQYSNQDFGNRQGYLKITKVFDPLTSGYTGTFAIVYNCGAEDVTVNLAAGGSTTVGPFPIGTSCTVSEPTLPTPPSGWSFATPSFSPAQTVTIDSSNLAIEVTVTNSISLNQGYFKISKVFDPLTSGFTGKFDVVYNCGAEDVTVQLAAGESTTVGPFLTGTSCTVTEPTLPTPPTGWTFGTPSISGSPATITTGNQAAAVAVTVTNSITRDTGSLKISKTVSNPDGATLPASFLVDYDCGTGYTGQVSVAPGSPATVNGIPTGSLCTVTEVAPDAIHGYSWGTVTYTPASVTISTKDSTFEITVGNSITRDLGNLKISKTLSNPDGAPVPASFAVNYDCGTGYTGQVSVAPGSPATVSGIPTGSICSVTEVAPALIDGYTWGTITYSPASVTIETRAGTFEITVGNSITRDRGALKITKTLSNTDSATVPASFTVNYDCGTGYTGQVSIAPGSPATVSGIPTGSTCTVIEVAPAAIPGYTWGTITYSPASVTIDTKDGTFEITVGNSITRDHGSLKISKTVSNPDGATVPASFLVDYDCGTDYTGQVSVSPSSPTTVQGIPTGSTCTVTEVAPDPIPGYSWGTITYSPASVTIDTKDVTFEITVGNSITRDRGSLKISKTLSNPDGATVPATFEVDYSCDDAGTLHEGTVNVAAGTFQTVNNIPTGSICTVTEVTPEPIPGFTWGDITYTPATVTIATKDSTFEITVGNSISRDRGSLQILKTLSNLDGASAPASFTVNYDCGTGYTGQVSIAPGSPATIPGIPTGSVCTVTEVAPDAIPGFTWDTISYTPESVTINTRGGTFSITVGNSITRDRGSLQVIKTVSNPDNATLPATFLVDYDCGLDTDGTTSLAGQVTITYPTLGFTTVTGIPTGNLCSIEEVAPAAIPGFTWGAITYDPVDEVTITLKDTIYTLTVQNSITRDRGNLKLLKTITGGPAGYVGPFQINYDCGSGYTGQVSVAPGSPATVIGIPTGTSCTISETLPDAPAGYSFGNPTFSPSATVTITTKDATVEVTTNNTLYQPTISKTAFGTYDEVHDWEVFKTAATAQKKFAGQSAGYSWTVRVDETTHGEAYLVTGDIIVVNTNPDNPITLSLSDVLNDGSIATIGPCTGGTWNSPDLTVPAGGTATCDYTVTPKGDLAAFAASLPAQVTEVVDYPESGDPAYFEVVKITNGGALNGTYEGWCIDQDHTINQNTNYIANVYSSYEALPAGLVEHPENFDLVNWIINQDYVYKPAGGSLGNYTYGDVQRAIWELIDDSPFSTSGLNAWNQTRVNQIKAAAIANGEGFVPTCGDFIAVVLQPVGGQQAITIAQVTFASLGVSCATSNTVTAVFNGADFPASANISWTANPVNPTATLDDSQNPAWPITVSVDQTFTYADPQGYTCPSDPSLYAGDGIAPLYTDPNTATITYAGGSKSATASTSVTCYGPIVSKTAAAEWRKAYGWTITKTTTPTSHIGFAGDSFTSDYDVFVDQTITDYGYLASGTITIKNPNGSPGNMTVNVADMVSGGFAATVDCDPLTAGNQTSVTMAANTTKTCSYTVSLPDNTNRVNTATGTFNNIGFTATANVVFGAPVIEGYPTINVTDSVDGVLGSAAEDKHFTYTRDFGCSTNAADYTDYADTDTYLNTATINETGASDGASVTVACYIPEISKTAAGTYGERHEWTVEKTVTPATQDAFAGATLSYEWKVVVIEEVFEEGFVASGQITVVNHNPEDAMTVTLSDVLSDDTVAEITTCTGDTDLSDGLTIAAGDTSICDYSATLGYSNVVDAPTDNTATAVLNGLSYTASHGIAWTPTKTRDSATVTDDQIGLNQTISDGAAFTGSEEFTCSTDFSDYAGDGTDTFSESNTAIVTSGGAEEDRDSATETINCYGPVISKTAAGTYDERHEWDVEKSISPVSQSGFAGDILPFTWTIDVTESVFEENFDVAGTVTVQNPAPMAMTVTLADLLSDSTAVTINGCTNAATYADGSLTIPANTTTVCDYTADDLVYTDDAAAPTGNTATATLNGIAFVATDPIEWAPNVIRGEAELTDLQGALSETITGSGTWTVEDSYTCSIDDTRYTSNYSYSETILNTATVTSEELEQDSSTSTETITCVIPEISKTASGDYDERHEWDVIKTVTPVSQSAFAGDIVSYQWTITVTEGVFEENFVVNGTITIVNHNTEDAMAVALSDVIAGGTTATITACTGDADLTDGLTIAAGGNSVCDYTASLTYDDVANAPTNNTATAVLNGHSYSASDTIEWAANVIRGTATLDDDQNPAFPLNLTDGGTWKYSEDYTCSVDKTLYNATTHIYTFGENNLAIVTSGGAEEDRDDASVSIDCYVPAISKTAAGSYEEVHDWEVFKSVNTPSQTAFAGEKRNFTWTVRVDETTHGETYLVTGDIVVVNPNPEDALTVALSDALDDGSVATIGPCTGGTWSSPNLTIPAGGTATCGYTVTPKGDMALLAAALPATVTINSVNPGPDSYWLTTVSNDAALNGVYEAWCVDIDHTMNPGTNYTAAVYSSYEAYPSGLIEKGYDMDLVNWIINQNYVGTSAAPLAGNYTYGDVQRAIWEIIEDNPTANTNGLGSWNQARVDQIEALARANGQGFVPTCGDFVAVLLVPTGGQQPIAIAQVTFASLGLECTDKNNAKAVLNGVEYATNADISWTATKINETATLDDDQKLDWPVTVSADTTFTYQDPQGITCSSDPADYTNGFKQYNESNTAVLTYQTGSDTATASTAVKCYAPVVTKTAAGAYDERHEWDVEKTVNPTTQDAFAGDTVSYDWTVTVVESVFEENFVASGTISVKNPRPDDGNMTVKLTDQLSDDFVATITGCTVGTWNATNKTVAVPPNSTAVCSYTASLAYSDDANAPTLNTVTAELIAGATHLITTASDAVEWTANVIRSGATLDDDHNSAFPLDITDGGTWTYSESYTCSTTRTDYGAESAWYKFSGSNTAFVTSGDERDRDTSSTEVNCYWPASARVVKATVEGAEDIGQFPFIFELYNPSGTKVETQTLNVAGEVAFAAELKPEGTWKIVEVLPAGWVNTDASLECTFAVDYWADAGKTFSCTFNNTEMSRLKLLKWTQGVINPAKSWTFSLWSGMHGFGGTQLATSSTSADLDGILDFGNMNLSKYQAYTLCEESVPAGWTSFWQVDSNGDGVISDADAILNPYNPNASDNPPQDLGNRCVDLGAGTGIDLLAAGRSLLFMVNNTYPGGEPRTPGYWKNWNRVTGGGQDENAARNGGYREGFWLLEDVLDPQIGGGIIWDDILNDSTLFPITKAAVAVDILDQREIAAPDVVGDGPKHSNDAAYTLAMHLLAAQLNFGAGARTCDAAQDTALAGEQLLDKYNFQGIGDYLLNNNRRVAADYALALRLATTLDQYNNGLLCAGPAVSFVSPQDGDTVTGVQAIVVDAMDQVPVSKVEFFVDGVKIGEDTVRSDGWSIDWDSTTVADGSRVLSAVATNSLNQTGSGDVTITVDNVADPVLPKMHVGDLSAATSKAKAGKWNATVTVTIHSDTHSGLSGAVVSLMWSDGIAATCTTSASGTCTVTRSNIGATVPGLTLEVTGVTLSGYEYDSSANEESNITVNKPL